MPGPWLPLAPARLRAALAACAFSLGLAAPALRAEEAAEAPNYGRGGLYGSVGFAFARNHFETGGFGSAFDDVLGFDARAGYRAGPRLAAEFELELQGFDFRQAGAGGAQLNNTLDTMVWTANLKGFLLPGRVQPFVQAGAGLLAVDVAAIGAAQNDVGAALRFGLGVDAHLSESFALTAGTSYVLPLGVVSRFDYYTFTAGIQYTLRLRD